MASFNVELPNDIIKQFDTLDKNTNKMLEEMTAKVIAMEAEIKVLKEELCA